MENEIGREAVLTALKERAPKSMHLMEVVGALDLSPDRKDEVRDVLEQLKELGMAREMPGNRFRAGERKRRGSTQPVPEATAGELLQGWLTINPRGFGFVATEDGGPDVFVPGVSLGHAMHGDRVRVRARPSTKGREGEVVDVVRHGVGRVAGVLRKSGGRAWIEPGDPRMPERVDVTGTIPLGVEPGEEVVAIIEKYPERDGERMEARVLGTLGVRGSAAVEIEKIKIREGIEEEFPDEVLAEAQAFGTRVNEEEIRGREDLRPLALMTIDPPDARDHDDAVWAERRPGGSFRVVVAIADVSYYVRDGSALDQAALDRATSIYLPDRVIPMLPHELSSNLASLVPDEDRLTLAVEVDVGKRGEIKDYRFIEGVMRSRARLSYQGVALALGLTDDGEEQPAANTHLDLLKTLWDVSQVLRAARKARGSLDFDLPEAEIELGDDGEPIDIRRSRTDPGVRKAYGMIEDLMLLANEVVAADLGRRGIPAIYRVHGKPSEDRIAIFSQLAESLGYDLDEDAGEKPGKLAEFLKRIEGTQHAQALNFLLLRSMQQASYDTTNIGHFALAAEDYLHFTSPIRRYPDLAVHRVVRELIKNRHIDRAELAEKLTKQAATSSRLERRAMQVDREATDLYRAIMMKDRVGESFPATISGVAEHGVYVTFDEPFVDAKAPIATLGEDWYELDELGLRLVGRRSGQSFAAGDRVVAKIENVSISERQIQVAFERPEGEEGSERPRARRTSRSTQSKKSAPRKKQAAKGKRPEWRDGKKTERRQQRMKRRR
jgi:ribonuclease R